MTLARSPFITEGLLAQFQALNVVEILKYGLSGLMFLFALLSFWLLYAEQKRDPPRPKMLHYILAFLIINFAGGLVVAAVGLIGGPAGPAGQIATAGAPTVPRQLDFTGFSYSCDHSTFLIDMSGWKRLPLGVDKRSERISEASFTRNDLLRKLNNSSEDYVLRPWTTGAAIDKNFLQAPPGIELSWKELPPDGERRRYEFTAPVGKQPAGAWWPISITFTIWNGFQGEDQEDWRADIQVPTRFVSFFIRFPKEKVVTEVSAFLDDRAGGELSLSRENAVMLAQDQHGQDFATWTDINIPGKHYVKFVWKWHDRAQAQSISR